MSPTGWGHLSLSGILGPPVATSLWRFVALTRAWENLRIRKIGSPAIRLEAAGS
jgi:hypothetical protein